MSAVLRQMKAVGLTVRATLREIFDESAYERYLAREGAEPTRESYRDFLNDRSAMMSRKPRCC